MEPPSKKRKTENLNELVEKLTIRVLELERKLENLKKSKDYSSSYIS